MTLRDRAQFLAIYALGRLAALVVDYRSKLVADWSSRCDCATCTRRREMVS